MNGATQTADTSTQPKPAIVENIKRALAVLFSAGDVTELRILNTRYKTVSGYFDDLGTLDSAGAEWSGQAPAVYVTLNPVNPALLARSKNRVTQWAKTTTSDGDIARRCWLPIADIDPVRPAGISSTDAEHELAITTAKTIARFLVELGIPQDSLVIADSGNGAHVLIRIDLPNDNQSTELVQRCIEAVALRFTTDKNNIDLGVFNAARIWKLYGTLACKGDNTTDRPHRFATILWAPKEIQIAPREILDKLARLPPDKPKANSNGFSSGLDLESWIGTHLPNAFGPYPWNGGRKWLLDVCPWNPDHTNRAMYVVQHGSGAIAAGCHHNGCAGKNWHDLRDIIEPGWRERNAPYSGEHLTPNLNEQKAEGVSCYPEEPEEETGVDTQAVPFPESAWTGLFAQWREITAPCTEAPLEYLWASCLVTVGLALHRNVRIENPRPLYPNSYNLLLGPTGDDRKSTALWLVELGLEHAGCGDEVDILKGIQSAESIYTSLARQEGAKSLAYCDEFRSLLSVSQRKGTQDIIPRLGSLYYCPARDVLNRADESKKTEVRYPFFSLIGATPREYISDLLSAQHVDGGFLNRFLVITGKVREWKPIAQPPSGWERFTKPLQKMQKHYQAEPCRLEWTAESVSLWTEFYKTWKTKRQMWSAKEQKLTARIDEHVLKLAMVYSAIERQHTITVKALATAITIGEWLQSTALSAFSDVGHDSFSKAEKVVLDIVKTRGKITRRYLQQWVHKKGINGEFLARVIISLTKNGQVQERKQTMLSGQEKLWVEYIPTDPKPVNS